MIYVWLEYSKLMIEYKTHEEFQDRVGWMDEIRNQWGIIVMVEEHTPYWD